MISAYRFAPAARNRRSVESPGRVSALFVGVAIAALFAALLGLETPVPPAAMPEPEPLSAPAPLGATITTAADFPEASRIAACWTLANQSNALLAPRSDRSSDIVGPIYADACLGA